MGASHHKRISWVAPTAVLSGLIVGLLSAIGHHLFYSSLVGQVPPDDNYDILSFQVSKQEINIAAGTTFAFLVNASLGVAVSVAYVQLVWRAVKNSSLAGGIALGRLDDLAAATSNPVSLTHIFTWRHFPLLFSVAFISWLLPLAAIITPATLSVRSSLQWPPPVLERTVPNVDFASLGFTAGMYNPDGQIFEPDNGYIYDGPSSTVLAMAEAVVASGAIASIAPPRGNVSWVLDFAGPALDCSYITGKTFDRVNSSLTAHGTYNYISWNTGYGEMVECRDEVQAPFYHHPGLERPYQSGCYGPGNNVSASLFMAVFPTAHLQDQDTGEGFLLQCQLMNKTYRTSFSYVNEVQQLNFDTVPLDGTPINVIDMILLPESNGTYNIHDNSLGLSPEQILRRLSYQSIFDAFQQQFIGYADYILVEPAWNISTSMPSTVVGRRPELSFTSAANNTYSAYNRLQSIGSTFLYHNATTIPGINPQQPTDDEGTLPSAMEALFEKFVLSLMSAPEFQSNTSSPYAVQPVNVTHYDYTTIYAYSAAKLWLAYGLALAFALLVAALGAFALLQNRASYSLSFSTIFRVARYATMSEELGAEDAGGRDPLPTYLAKTKVWLQTGEESLPSGVAKASQDEGEQKRSLLLKSKPAVISRPVLSQANSQTAQDEDNQQTSPLPRPDPIPRSSPTLPPINAQPRLSDEVRF